MPGIELMWDKRISWIVVAILKVNRMEKPSDLKRTEQVLPQYLSKGNETSIVARRAPAIITT